MTNEPTKSYFVAGGTLTPHAKTYVTRQADARLFEALTAGEYCYILDTRQVGKSSLIVHAAQRLTEQGRLTAFFDLSTCGDAPTEEQWYGKLLADLARALNCEDEVDAFWFAHSQYNGAQRWFMAVRDLIIPGLHRPLVVFIDEIEAVRKLSFASDGFFAMLRGLHNLRATEPAAELLTICLAGVATPSELIQDERTTPYNIGRRIALYDFSAAEMRPLMHGLHGTEQQQLIQITRIGRWTAGHPYLTQRFCQATAETGLAHSSKEIDSLASDVFLQRQAQSDESNLQFVRRQILDDVAPLDLLELYRQVLAGRRVEVSATDPISDRLLLSGIVRVDQTGRTPVLRVRNQIYRKVFDRRWVLVNLPGAEQRRQRQALWRGAMRASALWAAAALVLVYAITREKQVNMQQGSIATLRHQVTALDSDLHSKTQDVAAAARRLDTLNGTIAARDLKLQELKRSEQRLAKQNADKNSQLSVTQREQRRATAKIGELQNTARTIQDESETKRQSALALMGSVISGQEFEALEHGLRAVAPALRNHQQPTDEAVQGLARAVNAGIYRLFQLRHNYRLETAEFSPDGKTIVTAGSSRYICLWDAATGRLKRKVTVLPATKVGPRVWSAVYSPDGRYLVTAGNDWQAHVWDTASLDTPGPICVWHVACGDQAVVPVLAVYSRSGKYFAVSGRTKDGNRAIVYATDTKSPVATVTYPGTILGLDFNMKHRALTTATDQSVDRYLAVSGKDSQSVRILDLDGAHAVHTYTLPQTPVRHVTFAAWDNTLFTASDDGNVSAVPWAGFKATDTPVGSGNRSYSGHQGPVSSVTVSPDGFLVASAGLNDCHVNVWDVNLPEYPLYTLSSQSSHVMSVKIAPDSKRLVTAGYDGVAEVWIMDRRIYSSGSPITYVSLAPDGKHIVASTDRKVSFWPTQTPADDVNERWEWQWIGATGPDRFTGKVYDAEYSADGKNLATAAAQGDVRIWDVSPTDGKMVSSIHLIGHDIKKKVNCVALSKSGSLLISASDDQTARVWDVRSRRQLWILPHPTYVTSCAFSPDGSHFVTGCADGATKIFSISDRTLVRTWQPSGVRGWDAQAYPWSVSFSPDGRSVLTGDADGDAYLWDSLSGKPLMVLPTQHAQVFCAQFSHDGGRVLTVSEGGYADVWEVTHCELAFRNNKPVTPALSLRVSALPLFGGQFSPDGNYIYVGGKDTMVRKLPITIAALIKEAHRIRALGGKDGD